MHLAPSMNLSQTGASVEQYLNYLARRQTTIASNIANADTPGYKTLDVPQPSQSSFASVLQQETAAPVEVQTGRTQNDGNNVDLDRESRLLAENTLRFNISSQLLKNEFKQLRLAIEDGKSA